MSEIVENTRITPGNAARGEIEIVQEDEIWSGESARLFHDHVRFPPKDGHAEEARQVRLRRGETHDDGVVVAPIREDGRILLILQFRHAARMWLREIPRGAREYGESVEDAAARELREEIGHTVIATRSLGRIAPDGAQLETVPYLVAALVKPGKGPDPEGTEAIERIVASSYPELRAACERGEIIDSFTLGAVLRLAPLFDGERLITAWSERARTTAE